MPIYEFQCQRCGFVDEEVYSTYDKAPKTKKCLRCNGRMYRVISACNFTFKGEPPPSVRIKRKREDAKLGRKVKRAKKLKATGKVPMEETINLNDSKIQD